MVANAHASPNGLTRTTILGVIKTVLIAAVVLSLLSLGGCGASSDSIVDRTSITTADDSKNSVGALTTGSVPASGKATAAVRSEVTTFTSVATPGSSAYKIGPFDALDVSVFKVPELSRVVQVADNGTINLPLVGEVPAAGSNAQDVERELAKRLGAKFLRNPQVTVLVKEYNSQRVTFEGAVKKPGVYPIQGKLTLLQAVAIAGGLDGSVSSEEVVIFRQGGSKRLAGRFDIAQIRSGEASDPLLQEGDVIVANTSQIKSALSNVMKVLPMAAMVALF